MEAALGLWPPDPASTTSTRSTTVSTTETTTNAQVLTPYLCVTDSVAALAFYRDAFGAFETMRVVGDDGRMGHSEFVIGGARFMMADEFPEIGVVSPSTLGGTPVALHLEVVDVDHAHSNAVRLGATSLQEPADQTHGNRHSTILDPFGHRWMLSQVIEQLSTEEYAAREEASGQWSVSASRPPVEVGYITMPTPGIERSTAFFGELFGWQVEEGSQGPGNGHINNTRLPMGMSEQADAITLYLRVDDIEPYAAKVEELGGQVLTRNQYASGGNAECVDDQGVRFDLFQPAPGY
jgi:PhnB protein